MQQLTIVIIICCIAGVLLMRGIVRKFQGKDKVCNCDGGQNCHCKDKQNDCPGCCDCK